MKKVTGVDVAGWLCHDILETDSHWVPIDTGTGAMNHLSGFLARKINEFMGTED